MAKPPIVLLFSALPATRKAIPAAAEADRVLLAHGTSVVLGARYALTSLQGRPLNGLARSGDAELSAVILE